MNLQHPEMTSGSKLGAEGEDAHFAQGDKSSTDSTESDVKDQAISGGSQGSISNDGTALASESGASTALPICGRTMRFEFACELN